MKKVLLLRLRSAGTTPFSPGSIPGLWGWYDFSDLTTMFTTSAGSTPVASDGDLVGRVEDKSGNARHLTTVDANRPTYKTSAFGSKSAILFGVGGVGKVLATAVNLNNLNFTTIAVIKTPATITGGVAYSTMTSYNTTGPNGTRMAYIDTDGVLKESTAPTTVVTSYGVTPTVSTAYIFSATANSDGSPLRRIQLNQQAAVTDNTAITSTDQLFRVGVHSVNNLNNFWTGHIGEILIYVEAISDSDTLLAQTFLNGRWGVY